MGTHAGETGEIERAWRGVRRELPTRPTGPAFPVARSGRNNRDTGRRRGPGTPACARGRDGPEIPACWSLRSRARCSPRLRKELMGSPGHTHTDVFVAERRRTAVAAGGTHARHVVVEGAATQNA